MRINNKAVIILIIINAFIFINLNAAKNDSSKGTIHGQLLLNDIWNPIIYLSYIPDFTKMNALSYRMIISKTTIDSLGNFSFDISFLPKEDNLFRLHLVKKGNPATSLIIGGKDENHIFLIANCNSSIQVTNKEKPSLFKEVKISGSSSINNLMQITKIVKASNNYNFNEVSSTKREFIEKSTSEKLRNIADTTSNPLVSLFAIYKNDFESNYSSNVIFYRLYLKKWKNNNSTYFIKFREQLPIKKKRNGFYIYFFILLFIIVGSFIYYFAGNSKNNQLNSLSVQERKILVCLQKGATNKQISDEFNIGVNTVKSHVSSIYSKLKVKSRSEVMNKNNVC